MTRITIPYTDDATWRGNRIVDVTSTESAALFGHHPRITEFELWHRKKEGVEVDFVPNERMDWGNDLQDSIALSIARRYGVLAVAVKDYMRIDGVRMGASFDFEITGHSNRTDGGAVNEALREMFSAHGAGILEIKNVDYTVFRDKWLKRETDDDAPVIEPPGHIDIQLQHQLHVRERAWGAIGVLVGGNTGKLVIRLRDEAVGAGLEKRIAAFWKSIEDNVPPQPKFPGDEEFVASLYKTTVDRVHDGRGNADLDAAFEAYNEAGEREKKAKEDKAIAKAQWLQIIGDAARAHSDRFTVSTWPVAGSTYTVERKPYRGCRVSTKKGS